MSEKLERQNEAIIALLARSSVGIPAITKAVCGGKRTPEAYRKVYNALNGLIGVTDLAKMAGVAQPTMTNILKSWYAKGIVYNLGTEKKPQYHRLLTLPA